MNRYAYKNYIGNKDFVFARSVKSDETKASLIANALVEAGVKTFYDVQGKRDSEEPDTIAGAIEKSRTAVFFLSASSCESLEFRNNINYAFAIKKPIICIRLDKAEYKHGLDMQLANVQTIDLSDKFNAPILSTAEKQSIAESAIENLKEFEAITQDVLGTVQEKRNVNLKKQLILIAIIAVALAAFSAGAYKIISERVAYYRSAEYILRNADGSEYMNISKYGNEGLKTLSGKHIKELEFTGSSIDDFSPMSEISADIIDVYDCDNADFSEIMKTKNLKTVRVIQNQLKYIYPYRKADVEVEVIR